MELKAVEVVTIDHIFEAEHLFVEIIANCYLVMIPAGLWLDKHVLGIVVVKALNVLNLLIV